ncbi:hypothetical protein [Lactiplantibacillus plantarum]|uniref:hypothetical protein n=1 Tax=Lactiplantibacillus plantarum TaxID=1590 RepID=UPI0003A239C0|nr:hypothetical protein [Lactiplantibacillus plantarum]AGL64387.2 Tail fiber [Lactiplantibacillus plantarum subsp. plantarum P-8]MCG0768414.1 phage tail protein [Lactiplantibacillus plantarum]MCG0787176.1 phage tail protein [Lactiplantibacillus plantarum]MCG0793250.1 phage tail protein [Lactiplantibacillus plantarum]MCG0802509.1 phage tail protein [Lactiplantibacillus plantarum]
MAESNATQVILTDDGLKIIKAQNTADNATGGVTNLNDPNSMSVIEKQTQASQYAGLTSQYNVILKRAKDANISTTDLTTAYTNLNTFMASILTDTTKASDVNRDTYKSLTDAYNTALSNVQAELSNSFNTDISNMQSNVSVASQAASSAVIVASQAATTGDNASQVASQAASAANQASADYTALSAGVKDGSVVHITTKTVIDSAVIGTAEIVDAAITDAKVGDLSANKLTAGTIDFNTIIGKNINASNITTGTMSTDRLDVDKLSALSANLGDVTTGSLKGVDIVANTFSTPNGSFTTDANGAITAKNMTLIGGTLTSPTINTSTINGSTVNGTTFHGGDIINDTNNTSKFYPTTISSDGHIYTTRFNPVDAMQTDLSTGALTTKYRAINTTNPNNHYEAYDTTLQADQIALFAGYTNGKDMSFTQSVTGSNQDGYVLISPLDGLTLHGDNQQITFNGTSDDVTPKGIFITPYGNINPNGTQNIWYVGNNMNMKTASFGIDANNKFGVDLFRPTFVDEIGAMGNRLPNGRLFLHATDNNAQMYLLNDGSPAFVSPTIYNRTYSYGANMFVTSSGRVGRSTSASKYKLAIARSDDTSQADRLMTLNPASWNDKVATEKMAESLSNGEIPVEAEINLKRHYGLIAEDLRDAGLDEFLITGKDGQIEGIEYDRLWTVLIPKIKQLNNRINELERKTL